MTVAEMPSPTSATAEVLFLRVMTCPPGPPPGGLGHTGLGRPVLGSSLHPPSPAPTWGRQGHQEAQDHSGHAGARR